MKDHIIICGLGNVGFHVFELLQRAGIQVAVISEKTHEEWAWQVKQSGGLFFHGDARDDNLLLDAGIKDAVAILALTNQDKVNLSIAVDAQKLNPKIKIISRIFDTELGNLVAGAFDIQQVFSTSELAAPVFAHSITREKVLGQFDFNGKTYLVSEESVKDPPANVMSLIAENDRQLIADSPIKTKVKISPVLKFLHKYYNLRTPAFVFFQRFIIILFAIIWISTFFLSWAMSLSFTNALYFVIATVSSVGYGDINFLNSPDHLKYFGCILMLTGTAIIAILFSAVTEIFLANKLPNITGGRPTPKKNHAIVVGAGHIGSRIVCSLLESGMPVVIIEKDANDAYPEDVVRQVSLVKGNAKSEDTLVRANIKHSKVIFAITDDDIENLSISIAAKKMNPTIIEVSQINNTKIGGTLQRTLSLASVVSVPNIAAPYFVAAIYQPDIIFAIEWHSKIIYGYQKDDKLQVSTLKLT